MRLGPRANGDPAWPCALAIFVLVLLALLPRLGAQQIWSREEARPALVAREMRATGEWAVPHIGGRVYAAKPPLFPWLVAVLSPRGVSAVSLRLPSVLAAAGTAALTYALGAQLVAPGAGLVAAAALASSFAFVQWARTGRMEMLLTFWITLGCWSLLRWLATGRRTDAVLLGLWMGLGVLTKGPSGLVPAAVAAIVLAAARPGARGLGRAALACALAAGGVPALWLLFAWLTAPDAARYLAEVGPKFVSELAEERARNPLALVGVGFLPWTLWLPLVAVLLARAGRRGAGVLLVPLAWIATVLLIFSTVVYARDAYFLPLYPPLALLVGWAWQVTPTRWSWALGAPLVVAGIGVAAVVAGVRPLGRIRLGPGRAALDATPTMVVLALLAVGAAAGGLLLLRARRRVGAAAGFAGATIATLIVTEVTLVTPALDVQYPIAAAAARLAEKLPPDALVAYVDRHHVTALVFHLPHRSMQLASFEEMAGFRGRRGVFLLVPEDAPAERAAAGPDTVLVETVRFHGTGYALMGGRGAAGR